MHVGSLLKSKGREVVTAEPGETVSAAAGKLKRHRIGALVVSEDGVAVLGIISERDIARALAEHGTRLGNMRVEELMTRNVVTCAPDDSIDAVREAMTERRVRHLPVIEDGALCGIVSIGDVVKNRLEEIEQEAEALREYIAGS